MYGGGKSAEGKIERVVRDNDRDHCPDVSAITAAALAHHPPKSEIASFRKLHGELLECARVALDDKRRPARDPHNWKSGAIDQVGLPSFAGALQRQFSWWFNTSLEQLGQKLGVQPRPCK